MSKLPLLNDVIIGLYCFSENKVIQCEVLYLFTIRFKFRIFFKWHSLSANMLSIWKSRISMLKKCEHLPSWVIHELISVHIFLRIFYNDDMCEFWCGIFPPPNKREIKSWLRLNAWLKSMQTASTNTALSDWNFLCYRFTVWWTLLGCIVLIESALVKVICMDWGNHSSS